MRVAYLITTFNRSRSCRQLVEMLAGDVYIVDDGSEQDYRWAHKYNYKRLKTNGGKKDYWRTVTALWQMVKPKRYDYYIMLPDDFIPEPNFVHKALTTWNDINEPKKICLNLYVDKGRKGKTCWTNFEPVTYPYALQTQWVDMCFLAQRKFFEVLGWQTPKVTYDWRRKPEIGSRVGAMVSRELHKKGYTLWQTHASMFRLAPEAYRSMLNPHRKAEDAQIHDIISGVITAKIASIPDRVNMLEKTVASLRPQVDKIFIGLNNYINTPRFLKKGEYVHLDNSTGDAAKFYDIENTEGYVLTCDDDLIYPENYVRYMISNLHRYNAVTTLHGKRYKRPFIKFNQIEENVRCTRNQLYDAIVDAPGTGVTCFHTDMIKVRYEDFKIRNMADIWFAKLAAEQNVKIVALAHPADYLIYQNPGYTIFVEEQKKEWKVQNALLGEIIQ